jgi:hypothetical protein
VTGIVDQLVWIDPASGIMLAPPERRVEPAA